MSNNLTVKTDVLVVGAGPAGAAAAALLATYEVDTLMINKRNGVSNTPRAHITNQRTMEVLRDLGLEKQAIQAATPQHLMGEHVYATSLSGPELGRLRTWYNHPSDKAEHDLASPTSVCDLPQDRMEPILVNAASYRGAQVRNNTELLAFEEDDCGVTSQILDLLTGEEITVRSKYLIGADGGRSRVAEQLQLPFEGEMGEGGSINVVFRADLSQYVAHRPGDMYWFIQPGVGHDGNGIGVLRVVEAWDRWVGVWGYDPSEGTPDLSDDTGIAIAHQLIGDSSIPVEIESVSTWSVNHMFALDNMTNRVFVVGDAAHRHSPMNGLGSNTSIQDSYNLAWKLAFVLQGKADSGLLQSYRAERLPIAQQIVDRASRSNNLMAGLFKALKLPPASNVSALEAALSDLNAHTEEGSQIRADFDAAVNATLMCFNTHGMELNQFYTSDAIVTNDEVAPIPARDTERYHFPSSFPGYRVPHAWVLRDQHKVSTLDLCGKGDFTLIIRELGTEWRKAIEAVNEQLQIQINIVSIGRGCDYEDAYGDFSRAIGIEESGALLIRPDQMVAWRALNDDAHHLVHVVQHILSR